MTDKGDLLYIGRLANVEKVRATLQLIPVGPTHLTRSHNI